MKMEDDKIRELFGEFKPSLSSDISFIERLDRNLDSVEIIRQHNLSVARNNRLAIFVAAIAGFVVGVIFSLALPVIIDVVSAIGASLPVDSAIGINADNNYVIAWIIVAAMTAFSALSAYDITLVLGQKSAKVQKTVL